MDLPTDIDWYSSRPMNINGDYSVFQSSIEVDNEFNSLLLYVLNIEYKEVENHSLHLAVYETKDTQHNPIETIEIENVNYDDIPESHYIRITHSLGGNDNHVLYALVSYLTDNGQKSFKTLLHRFEFFIDPEIPIQHEIIYNFWSDIWGYKMDIDNDNRIYLYPYPGFYLEKDINGHQQLIIRRIDGQSTSNFEINIDFDCTEGYEGPFTYLDFLGTRNDGMVYLFISQTCVFGVENYTNCFVTRIYDFDSDISNPIKEVINYLPIRHKWEIAMNKVNQNVYFIQVIQGWKLYKIDQDLDLSSKEISISGPSEGFPRIRWAPNIYFDINANCLILINHSHGSYRQWSNECLAPGVVAVNYQNGEIEDFGDLPWSIEHPQDDFTIDVSKRFTHSAVYFKKDGINRIATVGPNILCKAGIASDEPDEPENILTLVVFKEEEEEEEEEGIKDKLVDTIIDLGWLQFLKFIVILSCMVLIPIIFPWNLINEIFVFPFDLIIIFMILIAIVFGFGSILLVTLKPFKKNSKVIFKNRITQKDKKDGL